MRLAGVRALITGGASGLGEGTARHVVAQGGRAAIVDLPSGPGERVAAELGDAAVFVPADVTSPEQVRAAVDAVAAAFGGIDLCVNAAGVADAARTLSKDGSMFPLETFAKVVSINLLGLFDVVRNAARVMSANDPGEDGERGLVVNVASIAAFEGQVGQAAYAASKGGVAAMTLPLARDLAPYGIRVVAIAPGIFDTGMLAQMDDEVRERLVSIQVFPKRLGLPADFARLVAAIAENTVLNGEVVRLDAATRLPHR